MVAILKQRKTISLPVTLEQIAYGLRSLSARELETLAILLDRDAIKTIQKSIGEAQRGKLKKLSA